MPQLSAWDRFLISLAPKWGLERVRARAVAANLQRHYEAAARGRRTDGWSRQRGDSNALISVAGAELRLHARDLIRNNAWARKAQSVIANNVVGWGIVPKADGENPEANRAALAAWKLWAESTDCDLEGRSSFAGIQHQVMRAIVSDGEVLVVRRRIEMTDEKTIPLRLEVLEADYLDTLKDDGARLIQGVEYDANKRRVAYWIFPEHPGSSATTGLESRRVPAEDVLHVFLQERPGQARGVSWLGAAIVTMKDLDEYEDAELMKQKIAACFAAFVTEDGVGNALGEQSEDDELVETFEPGMIVNLPPGKQVTTATPPTVTDMQFANRTLRRIAAGLGVTYEDLTGDYSLVNFSSARMGRIAHQANVRAWQANMLIPVLCQGVWKWAMELAVLMALIPDAPPADWTVSPLPMLEPDKEGLAYQRLVRVGAMTYSGMIRELGADPEAHLTEYAADQKKLDELKIRLDSDVRAVSQQGLTQERVGLMAAKGENGEKPPAPAARELDSDEFEISVEFEKEFRQ